MMKVDEKIHELITNAAISAAEKAMFEAGLPCESPIEGLLRAAFIARQIHPLSWIGVQVLGSGEERIPFEKIEKFDCRCWFEWQVVIIPQAVIGDYRVDFLAMTSLTDDSRREKERFYLAVECDGHEFHEKTKEQAARDKMRDRYLLGRHIPVMRFTGSEIWRDPSECAGEVLAYFEQKLMPDVRAA